MNLHALLTEVGCSIETAAQIEVLAITLDSRAVEPGTVFIALQGTKSHGMNYVEQAVAQGAVAVLHDQWEGELPASVPCIHVVDLRSKLGRLAHAFYQKPCAEMPVIGVTGTNGKTTTVHLMGELARAMGRSAGRIGTLGVFVGVDQLVDADRTTPDALRLAEYMRAFRDRGVELCAMEVSSHALDQERVSGVPIKVAVFTNLTRDHLDYHGTMEAYGAAKARLFKDFDLDAAVIDVDDPFGARLAQELTDVDVWTVGHDATARIRLTNCAPTETGSTVEVEVEGEAYRLNVPLLGQFNAKNALYSITALSLATNTPWSQVASATSKVRPAPGRMESFVAEGRPTVVIDFAHTPDALENALVTSRWHAEGALWVVFGCGGDRDKGKRPLMGEVASRYADRIVITSDNPRSEDPKAIKDDILSGIACTSIVDVELDRATAIKQSVAQAAPQDLILVAGKGHERTQVIGAQTLAYSDRAVVADLFGLLNPGGPHAA